MYAHSSVYVFIDCKLESFFFLPFFKISTRFLRTNGQTGRHGFKGNVRSGGVPAGFAQREAAGAPLVSQDVNYIDFCNHVWKLRRQWSVILPSVFKLQTRRRKRCYIYIHTRRFQTSWHGNVLVQIPSSPSRVDLVSNRPEPSPKLLLCSLTERSGRKKRRRQSAIMNLFWSSTSTSY